MYKHSRLHPRNWDMEEIIRAWQASDGHVFNPAADEHALTALEQHLQLRLPPEFRRLYQFSDGASLLGGNLSYWPLRGQDFSLWESTRFLRECHHVIPEEVLVFADNGSESLFGVWLQPTGSRVFQSPILEIGEIHEPGCMAIAGTNLVPFLRGWTAHYLLLQDDVSAEALDALGLQDELRFATEDMDDEHFALLRRWADPKLPDPDVDPYKSRYDADAFRLLCSEYDGS
jgi:hypothetical protein